MTRVWSGVRLKLRFTYSLDLLPESMSTPADAVPVGEAGTVVSSILAHSRTISGHLTASSLTSDHRDNGALLIYAHRQVVTVSRNFGSRSRCRQRHGFASGDHAARSLSHMCVAGSSGRHQPPQDGQSVGVAREIDGASIGPKRVGLSRDLCLESEGVCRVVLMVPSVKRQSIRLFARLSRFEPLPEPT